MTSKLNLSILLLGILAITTFAGCKKADEAIDEAITKHILISSDVENTPDNVSARLGDLTIGGTTFASSLSGYITLADNMPYTLHISTNPITDAYNVTNTLYSGTIPGSMFNDKSLDKINVKISNLVPTVYVNGIKVPSSGGTGTGIGSGSGIDTLSSQLVTGKMYERKIIHFTVPSGAKTLTVKITEFDPNTDRNKADLFVRKGSDPIVNHNPPQNYDYTWTADGHSINPNRADDICTFNNPGSGEWSALLYGFNDDFDSRLVITVNK